MKYFKKMTTVFAVTSVALMGALLVLPPQTAEAAFNSNRIIDDAIFDNSGSMSAAQIDAFLNARSSCISTSSGFDARIPSGYSPSGGFTYGGFVSAGQVIATSAQVFGLNPQVLLATLQKEQSLVSASSAYCNDGDEHKYAAAAGYGCPDGGTRYNWSGVSLYRRHTVERTVTGTTCVNSAAKAGFSQQVIRAAWLLKFGQQRSLGNTGWAVINGSWNNSDDPATCYGGPMTQGYRKRCSNDANPTYYDGYITIDGAATHMGTGATAALYWYTPHFHGNQNFVALFESWFGSTQMPSYAWQYQSSGVYTDNTKATPVDSYNQPLQPGGRYYFTLSAKNVGNTTWQQGSVRLGTARPTDHASALYDGTWPGPSRAANLIESSVAPGETGNFEFWAQIPYGVVDGKAYFNLVVEGVAWMNDLGANWVLRPANFSWQYQSSGAYSDNTKVTSVDTYNQALTPGTRYYFTLAAVNTGNIAWKQGSVRLGTSRGGDRLSQLYDGTWPGATRAANLVESTVSPGQVGHFEFWVTVPSTAYGSREYFNLLAEGTTWMNDIGAHWVVHQPSYSWQYQSSSVYTNSSKTTPVDSYTQTLAPNTRYYFTLSAKNTGNVAWNQSNFRLGTAHPGDRTSQIYDSSWLGATRPAALQEATVAPGQTGTFEFWITTPNSTVNLKEYFNPLVEGVIWLNDIGAHWVVKT